MTIDTIKKIKVLYDKDNEPFFPYLTADAIYMGKSETLSDILKGFYTKAELDAMIAGLGSAFIPRGTVERYDQLPPNANLGDLWLVGPEGKDKVEYVWLGYWEMLGTAAEGGVSREEVNQLLQRTVTTLEEADEVIYQRAVAYTDAHSGGGSAGDCIAFMIKDPENMDSAVVKKVFEAYKQGLKPYIIVNGYISPTALYETQAENYINGLYTCNQVEYGPSSSTSTLEFTHIGHTTRTIDTFSKAVSLVMPTRYRLNLFSSGSSMLLESKGTEYGTFLPSAEELHGFDDNTQSIMVVNDTPKGYNNHARVTCKPYTHHRVYEFSGVLNDGNPVSSSEIIYGIQCPNFDKSWDKKHVFPLAVYLASASYYTPFPDQIDTWSLGGNRIASVNVGDKAGYCFATVHAGQLISSQYYYWKMIVLVMDDAAEGK